MDERTPEEGTQTTTYIPARPTLYKGIQMRSRLEANFAQLFLDEFHPGEWQYEPDCFASEQGQYLPDFHVDGLGYIEVKPAGVMGVNGFPQADGATSEVDALLERMEIIWASKPAARLVLVFWRYDNNMEQLFAAAGRYRVWWWATPENARHWALWPGRGQLEVLQQHRGSEVPSR